MEAYFIAYRKAYSSSMILYNQPKMYVLRLERCTLLFVSPGKAHLTQDPDPSGEPQETGQQSGEAMEKNERSTPIPGKEKEVDIINIKGIEDIGYVQPDSIVSHLYFSATGKSQSTAHSS